MRGLKGFERLHWLRLVGSLLLQAELLERRAVL
jgi:hypothetical protein